MGNLAARIARVRAPLEAKVAPIEAAGVPTGRAANFAYIHLVDASRSMVALEAVVAAGEQDPRIQAKSAELILREIVEQLIVLGYMGGDDDRIDRFLKTSAKAFEKSWGVAQADSGMAVSELPTYKDMAYSVDRQLHDDCWARLSHLSHPRYAQPYVLVERGNLDSGMSQEDFYRERIDSVISVLVEVVKRLIAVYPA
jgi:hypothetical protein